MVDKPTPPAGLILSGIGSLIKMSWPTVDGMESVVLPPRKVG